MKLVGALLELEMEGPDVHGQRLSCWAKWLVLKACRGRRQRSQAPDSKPVSHWAWCHRLFALFRVAERASRGAQQRRPPFGRNIWKAAIQDADTSVPIGRDNGSLIAVRDALLLAVSEMGFRYVGLMVFHYRRFLLRGLIFPTRSATYIPSLLMNVRSTRTKSAVAHWHRAG